MQMTLGNPTPIELMQRIANLANEQKQLAVEPFKQISKTADTFRRNAAAVEAEEFLQIIQDQGLAPTLTPTGADPNHEQEPVKREGLTGGQIFAGIAGLAAVAYWLLRR